VLTSGWATTHGRRNVTWLNAGFISKRTEDCRSILQQHKQNQHSIATFQILPIRFPIVLDRSNVRSGWTTWLVEDQRFVDHRPDVLTWVSEPLTNDVVVSGRIIANLFASTTGTDSDWIVKLINVYPEKYELDPKMSGYQLMIASDVFRGRYRQSFEKPSPIAPNAVLPYQIVFPANDHVFKKGHRIMVQVQSSWFPVIDRNPQRFIPNIFRAKESDFQAATQQVFRSGKYASNIALPVVQMK
jgi:uncharacterized protein